jgi:hypothetical protein
MKSFGDTSKGEFGALRGMFKSVFYALAIQI